MEIKRTIPEWVSVYAMEGKKLSVSSLSKRRMISGLGELTGPRKRYILTKDEFIKVANTPLPFCNTVGDPL